MITTSTTEQKKQQTNMTAKMAPVPNAPCVTIMKAFFVLGILVVLLGADAAAEQRQRGNRTQGRFTRRSTSSKHNIETAKLILNPQVLSESPPPSNPFNNSLSPWEYRHIHDNNLFPDYIVQAECLKKGCLDSDGNEDMSVESRPIYHQILVLRRVMGNPKKQLNFRLETKTIKVGCTCVRPIVLSQK
uniref:Interleukin 17a/f3 n=2 Tax=Scleropages formosus TaxID=113540 RepID=A0A8C9QT42_SCLFO